MSTAVGLVNALTDGEAGGRPALVPQGRQRFEAIQVLLTPAGGTRPRLTVADSVVLVGVAERLRRVFEDVEAGDLASAAVVVNGLLRDSGARPQLDNSPVDGWNVHFHGADDSVVTGWTAGCATGIALALGSDLAGRLGVCDASCCDRVYVDASRNGARRFCSAACQSRAKASAFRARGRRPGGSG